MPPDQQPDTATSHRVAVLRGLLQQPSSSGNIKPLVSALMARQVEIYGAMLTELGARVERTEGSISRECGDNSRVLERIQEIEQDARRLRQLIKADEQRGIDARASQDELQAQLSEFTQQSRSEIKTFEQQLQALQEVIEGHLQSTNGVKEILDTVGPRMKRLQQEINELKSRLEKVPLATTTVERLIELEERMANYFNNSLSDAETIKLFLARNESNPYPSQEPKCGHRCGHSIEQVTDRPTNNTPAPSHSQAGHGHTSRQPNLDLWPAVAQFLTIYEEYKAVYKSKKPGDEQQYIRSFLSKINVHTSCAFQRHLLGLYPNKVTLVDLGVCQQAPTIFIRFRHMRWIHIRYAVIQIEDLRVLQAASDEGLSGPPQISITK
ncbi:hypothetical protein F4802DRAFT_396194 [Xylaria palmicola]|nr:hypothetical protein F4802DRAFT_396194 [Xylaria palmicola]